MRAASPPRQMERENEMIVISHRLFCFGIRRKRVEGTEVIIGDLRGAFFRRTSPLHL